MIPALLLLLGGSAAEPRRPDVLLVTIDTLRADAAGTRKGTPAIEAFLETATHFAGARTPVPLTLPAHVSLFTGLLPASHGVHDNASPPIAAGRTFPLLAEEFAKAGYDTAAFASAVVLDPRTGLGSGFRSYEMPAPNAGVLALELQGEVAAEERVAEVLAYLGRRGAERPLFLWVHLFDPHEPYLAYAGDGVRPGTSADDTAANRYAGEVRRVDAALERLLAAFPSSTYVVLASDHGESLGEHGERTHGMLCHGATADVFLAARGPHLKPGAVDAGARSLCDVAPTLRAWCGLPEVRHDGARLFDPPRAAVVTESLLAWRVHGWGQCFSVSDGKMTLVEAGRSVAFYQRDVDPGETAPLTPDAQPEYEKHDRALDALRRTPVPDAPSSPNLGVDTPYGTVRRPDATYLTRPQNARLADPAERQPFWDALQQAQRGSIAAFLARDAAALEEVAATITALAATEPANPAPCHSLAQVCRWLGELEGEKTWHVASAEAFRAAIERGYWDITLLHALFEQALRAGDSALLRSALDLALNLQFRPDVRCARLAHDGAAFLISAGDAFAEQKYRLVFERALANAASREERRALEGLRPK
ncbi:MAG: sulfatase [Planctomycetaceae bacterium]